MHRTDPGPAQDGAAVGHVAPGRRTLLQRRGAIGAGFLLCGIMAAPARADEPVDVAARVFELVNVERRARGLPALKRDPQIDLVATGHSLETSAANHIYHDSPVTGSPVDRLREISLFFSKSGENVAMGPSIELLHGGLMNSPDHRRNILDPGFTHIGLGAAESGGSYYLTQIFLRVIPAAEPKAMVDRVLERLNSVRAAQEKPPLRVDPFLAEEAGRMVQSMWVRDTQHPGSLSKPWRSGLVKIFASVGEDLAWEGIEGEAAGRWELLGVGAWQGRTRNWPHGANWYVVLLGHREVDPIGMR